MTSALADIYEVVVSDECKHFTHGAINRVAEISVLSVWCLQWSSLHLHDRVSADFFADLIPTPARYLILARNEFVKVGNTHLSQSREVVQCIDARMLFVLCTC